MNHLDKQARREAQTSMVVKPAPLVPSVVNPRPDTLTVRDHFADRTLAQIIALNADLKAHGATERWLTGNPAPFDLEKFDYPEEAALALAKLPKEKR